MLRTNGHKSAISHPVRPEPFDKLRTGVAKRSRRAPFIHRPSETAYNFNNRLAFPSRIAIFCSSGQSSASTFSTAFQSPRG